MGESGNDPTKGQETAAPAQTTARTAREEEKQKGNPLRRVLLLLRPTVRLLPIRPFNCGEDAVNERGDLDRRNRAALLPERASSFSQYDWWLSRTG